MAKKDFQDWNYYLDLYKEGIKQPHSSIEKEFFRCEFLLDYERQSKITNGLFYERCEPLIGTFKPDPTVTDLRGRMIEPNDIVICFGKRHKPILHHWRILYPKGKKKPYFVAQCITPGYEQYRTRLFTSDILIQTDQILTDAERRHIKIVGTERG